MNKILVADKMHESITPMLAEIGYACDYKPGISREEILDTLDDYLGLIIRSKTAVDKPLIDAGVNLKFVGRAGAGIDQIDTAYLEAKQIALYNAPEGNRDALGEHAIGMLLSLLHKIHSSDDEIRRKTWQREPNRGIELKNKTVGIFGYGYMGSAMAEKLSGFGCRVIAYDKYKRGFGSSSVEDVDFDTFCEQTEILSIHVPLTEETYQLFDGMLLARFKKLMFIINTARGEVLVLKDLLQVLKSGRLLGAAFDVLENEKFEKYTEQQQQVFSDLSQLPNVLFTPHVGGWTYESYERINEVLVNKISSGKHI